MNVQDGINNTAICLFMGGKPRIITEKFYNDEPFTVFDMPTGACHELENLNRYQNNWEHIMEVVEMIEKKGYRIPIDYSGRVVGDLEHVCQVYAVEMGCSHSIEITKEHWSLNKKEAIYNAIVEFAHWYNNKTK